MLTIVRVVVVGSRAALLVYEKSPWHNPMKPKWIHGKQGCIMASQNEWDRVREAMLLAIVAAMLHAYAGTALARAVRGKSALSRSPTEQEILSWIYFWSTHARHKPLYQKRAPPFSWPVTTT